jgi:hypothetical protein
MATNAALDPVTSDSGAGKLAQAWALAGHPSHPFSGPPGEPYCRVCAGGPDDGQHIDRDELLTAARAARQLVLEALEGDGDLIEAAAVLAARAGDLLDLVDQIKAAARNVMANWESGDLAAAVDDLRIVVFGEEA